MEANGSPEARAAVASQLVVLQQGLALRSCQLLQFCLFCPLQEPIICKILEIHDSSFICNSFVRGGGGEGTSQNLCHQQLWMACVHRAVPISCSECHRGWGRPRVKGLVAGGYGGSERSSAIRKGCRGNNSIGQLDQHRTVTKTLSICLALLCSHVSRDEAYPRAETEPSNEQCCSDADLVRVS